MSDRVGGSRVPIPNNVRKTIQDIREITGKQHGDDDIYAVLKDCAMDPNETAQKLLYLDTFHEVKGRRSQKKNLTTHTFEESRSKQGGHGRVARGLRRVYSSNYSDAAGGRNASTRKENGVSYIAERTVAYSSVPSTQKSKNNVEILVTRTSTDVPNGSVNQLNQSSSHGIAPHTSFGGIVSVTEDMSAIDISKKDGAQYQASIVLLSTASPTFCSVMKADQGKPEANSNQVSRTASEASVSCTYSSSDPILEPSVIWNPSADANKREVGSQPASVGQSLVEANKLTANGFSDVIWSKKEKRASGCGSSEQKKKSQNNFKEIEKTQLSEMQQPMQQPSSLPTRDFPLATRSTSIELGIQPPADKEVANVEDSKQPTAEMKQHVTFPNHFQVPEVLKNGLTFGSFEASFGRRETCSAGNGGDGDSIPATESSLGSEEPTAVSKQVVSSTGQGNNVDYLQPSHYEVEKAIYSEGNIIPLSESKNVESKQEIQLTPEGTQNAAVQNTQNYSMNLKSNMLGVHRNMQFEGSEPQMPETSRILNSGGNPPALSSQSPTPLQSSISMPPHSVSFFRPPYAANYFPYSNYYPPIYLSPIHQYLGPNGFHQQPSAGNMYLPPAATGVNLPIPQLKPGINAGNPTHIGIASSSFLSLSLGYAASPSVNKGSSNGNEDLAATQLKENHVYTTGQLSEGSTVWIPPPGQDISSFQINSLYNILPPQGQNLTFLPAQVSHGGFAGTYQPGKTVPSASTLLQHSQAVAGALEPLGLSSGAYQQPQNWNSKF